MLALDKSAPSSKSTLCAGGCGATVFYRTNAKVLCSACKPIHDAARQRRAAAKQRRKRGVAVVKGTSASCVKCGTVIIRTTRTHKFCKSCGKEHQLEAARQKSRLKAATDAGKRYASEWTKKRRSSDPAWAISARMSVLTHMALGKGKAGRTWKRLVPYTLEELMRHLERQFTDGMSWENRGEWHIDHIIPRSSYRYQTPDDPEFKACWALSNLMPIWAADNHSKNARRTLLC